MQLINRKFKAGSVILTTLGLMFGLVWLHNHFITENISISEPIGYYLKLPVGNIVVGRRYSICLNNNKYISVLKHFGFPNKKYECPYNSPYLIKQVAGVPSDLIEITTSGVLVNGVLQPNSKGVRSGRGVDLYPLPVGYRHVLQSGEYFMLGVTPTSIDSRYFGAIKRDQIFNRTILLMNDD
jgi:signal peptidase I